MRFRSFFLWTALAFGGCFTAHAQGDVPDPVFSAVPFDHWITEGDQGHFRWSMHVGGAELNNHQRLQTRLEIQIDGGELVARRGHGELVILIQFQDSAEHVYQTHGALDLQDVTDEASKSNINYRQDAFVLPGDYRVSVALFDTKTKEHSVVQKPLHVNALRGDPLPGAWKDLPPVELLRGMEALDSWFLPYLTKRLQLPLVTRRPIHLEILMNASPSGPSRGLSVGTVNNRNLAYMLPALKVLSQVELTGGLNLSLLDIPKRSVMFQQEGVGQLDWMRLRQALMEADPNKIDVHALEHSDQNAQYFLGQVRQRLTEPGREPAADAPLHVLIVLSAPMTFNSGENMHPIDPEGETNVKVYYVRYHLPPDRLPVMPSFDGLSRAGRRTNPRTVQQQAPAEAFDSLAPLLKPLHPRMFDIYDPEQFRKALSTMLEEIARL